MGCLPCFCKEAINFFSGDAVDKDNLSGLDGAYAGTFSRANVFDACIVHGLTFHNLSFKIFDLIHGYTPFVDGKEQRSKNPDLCRVCDT
jgi:hypothetical protein